jgi:prolipoprotein diacylglyceryltransferase
MSVSVHRAQSASACCSTCWTAAVVSGDSVSAKALRRIFATDASAIRARRGSDAFGKIMLFALGGFVVGAATTALIVYNKDGHCDGCISRGALRLISVGAGGIAGALIGGAVGASVFRPERSSGRD